MTSKVKINIASGEIEFEGSEEFVERRLEALPSLLESLKLKVAPAAPAQPPLNPAVHAPNEQNKSNVPDTFGEWMHRFPSDISDQDAVLLTSIYVQRQSEANEFKTAEVNKMLMEHGVKVSNTSTSLNRLVSKKLLFQTRKDGKLKFLRVSKDGEAKIEELLVQES